MPGRLSHLEQTIDRRWRGGHPFRPRLSRRRRVGMMVIFTLLCAVIGTYWYLTDAERVRGMAEAYLSKVLGGRVDVGQANLSIFEGLRLDDIKVHVDQADDPDSVLFQAKTFKLDYNPRALLTGRIEAAQIVAIGPELHLTLDRDTGEWNYQGIIRAARERKKPTTRKSQPGPVVFPEILLRDGRVDNGEVVDGRFRALGSLGFEGRLSPTGAEGRYAFEIQCHGVADPVGPAVTGWTVPETGQVRLHLRDFAFGRDVRGMLPADVRHWWDEHALAGRIDATDLSYTPAHKDHPAEWRVETSFKGVTMRIRPEEWRGARQNQAMERFRDAIDWTKSFALGSPTAYPNLLFQFTKSVPVRLQNGQGTLVFDQDGLEIQELQGTIEGSAIRITGRYAGYRPDAPMDIHLASVGPRHITLPEQPKFIYTLPSDVQEIWRRFHPVGSCRLAFDVNRAAPGEKPNVAGEVEILDGEFTCDRFPYTLRQARGEISVGHDEVNGNKLELKNLRGYGRPGGPNEHGLVTVNGVVDHLGPDPGMHLVIEAKNVGSEPAVAAAIPMDVHKVLRLFDAPGKGEYPQFAGGFKCWINRPPGKDKHIELNIDLDIRKGSGRLQSFPYPLENFSARAEIRDDYVDIPWSHMNRNGTELSVTGRVRWEDVKHTGEKIGTDLKVAVKNMPIDRDLLQALTPVRRQWLQKVGLGGKLDFQGRVYSDKAEDDIVVDLMLGLKDGTIWPGPGNTHAVSNINGLLHLNGDELELQNLTGHRGDGTVSLGGLVSWKNDHPKVALKGTATNLALDSELYKLLPDAAHETWDAISPEGTIDATASFSGGFTDDTKGSATTRPAASPLAGLSLTVRPRDLAIKPRMAPYRLEHLTGQVTLADSKITLDHLAGHHGPGTLSASGTGLLGGPAAWALHVTGTDLPVDEEFLRGAPGPVASMLKSVSYQGPLSFDLTKLTYRAPAAGTAAQSSDLAGDLDFAGTLSTKGGQLDAGVPMTEVKGAVDLAGAVRDGHLAELTGALAADSMKIAGRDAESVKAEISKPAGDLHLYIKNVQGRLAGGAVSGDVTLAMPEIGPSRYAVNMVLRNADVRQVAGDESLNGAFTASLELEGDPSDPKSRMGRGDVLASGKEMYKVPLLMGLLQITNLSLPITSPFNEATAQYILQGNQMTFENIELRSNSIVMSGGGSINFDTKKVHLTFNTDSPTHWIKLPLVTDFWQTTKKELFQISIRGTVQEPKVSANPLHTFTTTVDEVLKGSDRGAGK